MNKTHSMKEIYQELTQIPGVGKSIAKDLVDIGIRSIDDLKGLDPQQMYDASNHIAGCVQDRCLLYVFRSAVYYAETPPASREPEKVKWWNWKDSVKVNSKKFKRIPKSLLLFCIGVGLSVLTVSLDVKGQPIITTPGSTLKDTILTQDSLLFYAFNHQDFQTLSGFFSADLEIYQDNIGVRNYNQSMEAFQNLFNQGVKLTRTLNKNLLEVYPIKGYGAIESGTHTFTHFENGELVSGTFKFLHIWKKENGRWQITRVVTYDH